MYDLKQWGQTCNKVCRTSSVLRKTEVRIVSNSQCSQKYGGTQGIRHTLEKCAKSTKHIIRCTLK